MYVLLPYYLSYCLWLSIFCCHIIYGNLCSVVILLMVIYVLLSYSLSYDLLWYCLWSCMFCFHIICTVFSYFLWSCAFCCHIICPMFCCHMYRLLCFAAILFILCSVVTLFMVMYVLLSYGHECSVIILFIIMYVLLVILFILFCCHFACLSPTPPPPPPILWIGPWLQSEEKERLAPMSLPTCHKRWLQIGFMLGKQPSHVKQKQLKKHKQVKQHYLGGQPSHVKQKQLNTDKWNNITRLRQKCLVGQR